MYIELILEFYLVENDDNIKGRNIPEKISFLCPIFSDIRMFIFGLAFVLYVYASRHVVIQSTKGPVGT